MFKRIWILGFAFLLAACGGGGGGGNNVPAYQPTSPGQGDVLGITVQDVTMGLVAPQFMVLRNNALYVADRTVTADPLSGTVRKIDLANSPVVQVATGAVSEPVGVAFDTAGNFFVTGTNSGIGTGLLSMNLSTGGVTNSVQGANPAGLVFDSSNYGYFVAGSGKVLVLTPGLFVAPGSGVSIGGTPNGLAYADGYVYVTRYDGGANGVSRFSTTGLQSEQVFASSTYFNGPTAIAVRASPFELYVVNTKGSYSDRSVLAISASGSVRVFLSAQNRDHKLCAPGGLAIDNSVNPAVLYIANGSCPGSVMNAAHAGKVLKVTLLP